MKDKTKEKKERGSLPGMIVYELIILTLTVLITARFCKIGLFLFGVYTVLINLILIAIGIVAYLAGFRRMKKFFSSRTNWSILLLLVPIIISFTNISGSITKRFLFLDWNEQFMTSITPSLMSTMFAILLLLAVILRNNPRRLFSKTSRFFMLAGDVLFISSFLNILCNSEMLPIPGINISCQGMLIVAVIFSWAGIKEVAGIVWAAVLILGVTRLCSIDSVMGFSGALYLLCAFLSGILQWLELDVHISLDGLKQQFTALNDDAVSLLSKSGNSASLPENDKMPQAQIENVKEPVLLPDEKQNDKTTC